MKDRKVIRISGIIALVLFCGFMLLLIFSTRQDLFSSRRMEDFSTGWAYSFQEKEGTVTLPASLDVPKDTEVTFRKTAPEEIREDDAIVFRSRMQYVQVYVGERLAYQFPERELIGRELTSAWNFVRLNESDAGKEIRIVVSSPYDRFSGGMGEMYFGDFNDMVSEIISRQMKIGRMSAMIGMVGAVILLLAVISRRYSLHSWLASQGILLVFVAFWLCGESRLPSGIVGLEAWHYFAVLSLLFCPMFMAAYLCHRWPDICGKASRFLFYLCLADVGASLASEFLGGPDLIELLPVTVTFMTVSLVYAVPIHILAVRRKEGEFIRSEIVCLLIIVLAAVAEAARFYRDSGLVGSLGRVAILIYSVNLLRISVVSLLRKMKENRELARRLRRSRAELMASQIKPHFIYNTLNSIRTLVKVDPEQAQKTVYDFSTYLRSNLENVGERELIPFSDELRHIQAYLNIEKVRFGERLRVAEDIGTKSFQVPPLSVQPLVENAVKHGICARMEGGTVTIRSREEADAYVVEVEDDGIGFDVESIEKRGKVNDKFSHIGLENIRFRIREIARGRLDIHSRPGEGTKVTVTFPKEERKGDECHAGHDRG